MNHELNQHKKSDSIKWIIVFIALAILFVGMAVSFIPFESEKNPAEQGTQTEQSTNATDEYASELVSTENVKLSATPMTAASGTNVSQTLTATVYPTTATNKLVDWSVAWGDSSNTATVTDYVTVTPSTAGSTTATVTCKQPFTGNIVVTVTTRENGYTAECIVTYVGKPTEIKVTSANVTESNGQYALGVGTTYTFNVALDNPFGQVGADFQNVQATLGANGTVTLGSYESYSSGSSKWYEDSFTTVSLDSLKDKFLTVNYANGVLSITTKKTIESYYGSLERIDGGRTRYYTDKYYSDSGNCYFTVTLREANSGLTKTMKIVFDDSVVASVSMNSTEISF